MTTIIKSLLVFIALMIIVGGCTPVKAYQRGHLAKPEMSWKPLVQQAQLNDHIYFSKEASAGGTQAAGGGCGCN